MAFRHNRHKRLRIQIMAWQTGCFNRFVFLYNVIFICYILVIKSQLSCSCICVSSNLSCSAFVFAGQTSTHTPHPVQSSGLICILNCSPSKVFGMAFNVFKSFGALAISSSFSKNGRITAWGARIRTQIALNTILGYPLRHIHCNTTFFILSCA